MAADRNESPILIVLALLAIAVSATSALLGSPKLAPSRPGVAVVPPSLDLIQRDYLPVSDSMVAFAEQSVPIQLSRDPFGPSLLTPASPSDGRQVGRVESADSMPLGSPNEPSWTVSAILISPSDRVAVVNDSLVKAGDRLPGGVRVLDVEANQVVLTDAQQVRHILRLREPGK